jgi:coenzyme PQQ precursor peptide PqqA
LVPHAGSWEKFNYPNLEEPTMIWETPAYVDIRLGFEVTMYVYNR